MELYNTNTGLAVDVKVINTEIGCKYVEKLTELELNDLGCFFIKLAVQPSGRYFNLKRVLKLIGSICIESFIATEKDIEKIKRAMTEDLNATARAKFETHTTKYHSAEMSHFDKLCRQVEEFNSTGTISNLIQSECNISGDKIEDFVAVILAKSVFLDEQKAYISGTRAFKQKEIDALGTVNECIFYESTPYTGEVEDMATGNMVEATLYRNNVKEW